MFLIHLKIIFHCRFQRPPELNLNLAGQIDAPKTTMFPETSIPYLHDYENHFIKTKVCCPIYIYSIRQKKCCFIFRERMSSSAGQS